MCFFCATVTSSAKEEASFIKSFLKLLLLLNTDGDSATLVFPSQKQKESCNKKKSFSFKRCLAVLLLNKGGIENQQHTQKAKLFPFFLSLERRNRVIFSFPPFFPAGDEGGEEEESHFAKAKHNRKSKEKKSHPPLSKRERVKKESSAEKLLVSRKKTARY